MNYIIINTSVYLHVVVLFTCVVGYIVVRCFTFQFISYYPSVLHWFLIVFDWCCFLYDDDDVLLVISHLSIIIHMCVSYVVAYVACLFNCSSYFIQEVCLFSVLCGCYHHSFIMSFLYIILLVVLLVIICY